MHKFSVVTIVKGRRKQLANLLESIKASTLLPVDVQVICMDNTDGIIKPDSLDVNLHLFNDTHNLPLAAARNAGIAATKTDKVIFIDVDCLVSPTLFENMLAHLTAEAIITAYPLYLSNVPENGDFTALKQLAVPHPSRQTIPAGQPVNHLQFWSLIFAVKKPTFQKIGCFDETFIGYGAEDTDFAMTFNKANIKLIFVNDCVLHQYHDKYDPPLNYFESIIENATRYKQKWGVLPMRRWLSAFEKMGLIIINENDEITVYSKPTDEQLKNSISKNPY
ncbi:glycosyltransferase family 2 protein [Mucilaginibacter pallidiroseus]|nr:glycosyltransferase [Mucilaginibacter pallidiroseus]